MTHVTNCTGLRLTVMANPYVSLAIYVAVAFFVIRFARSAYNEPSVYVRRVFPWMPEKPWSSLRISSARLRLFGYSAGFSWSCPASRCFHHFAYFTVGPWLPASLAYQRL